MVYTYGFRPKIAFFAPPIYGIPLIWAMSFGGKDVGGDLLYLDLSRFT